MNKFLNLKFLALAALALSFNACTNLETDENDSVVIQQSGGGFIAGDPTELLSSAYNDLGAYTDQANIYALGEHTSDEMIPPTRGTDWGDNGVWRTLDQHTWDATHAHVIESWNQLNSRVYKCNQVIASNPSAQEEAEARFLRAFNMFHVMDYFGQVPFRNVTDGVNVNPKVMTRSEAFDFIENDLTTALANLPAGGPVAMNSKATKAAANALLARLYMNKAVYKAGTPAGPYTFDNTDMDKVIAYANAVEADGYALEDEYFTNFTTNATKEIIFTSAAGSPANRWHMTMHYDQSPGGWNGFTTLADFYQKFEATEQRIGEAPMPDGSQYSGLGRGFLRGLQKKDDGTDVLNSRNNNEPLVFTDDVQLAGANSYQGIRVIKYHPKDNGQYILLRYADVLLLKAEAQMRKGDAAGALATVNQLRTKRGATAFTSVDEAKMLDERGRELYWEGGRRTDLIRFGKFTTSTGVTESGAHTVLFPIPADALTSNPNLKQNDGY